MKRIIIAVAFMLCFTSALMAQDLQPMQLHANFGNAELTAKHLLPILRPAAARDNYSVVLETRTRDAATLKVYAQAHQVSREREYIQQNIAINQGIREAQRRTYRLGNSRSIFANIGGSILNGALDDHILPEYYDTVFYKVDVTGSLTDPKRFVDPDIETEAIVYQVEVHYDRYGRVDHLKIIGAVDAVTGAYIAAEMPDQDYLTRAFPDFSLKLFTARRVLQKLFP